MDPKDLERIAARVAGSSGRVRTAGKIEFVKDTGPLRRDIRAPGFEWSQDSFSSLAKILWASQRAHTYAMAAYKAFSKMPSSQFSPDGLLGGRGYIQSIKDMRTALGQASESLANFADTVHDEINAQHWKPAEDTGAGQELLEDAERVKQNPDEFVEEQYDEANGGDVSDFTDNGNGEEEEPVANPDPEDFNPEFEADEDSDDGGGEGQVQTASFWMANDGALLPAEDPSEIEPSVPGSLTPKDGADQKYGKSEVEATMNTTTVDHGSYASSFAAYLRSQKASSHRADSSLPVDTLPGPRVDHIGPGEGTEMGHFNHDWDSLFPSDDPDGSQLTSGVNVSDPLYEDWVADGVTGDDNPTDGDSSVLMAAGYSWLPGSRNEKTLPIYDLDITDEDAEWMREHDAPDPPAGADGKLPPEPDSSGMWEDGLV